MQEVKSWEVFFRLKHLVIPSTAQLNNHLEASLDASIIEMVKVFRLTFTVNGVHQGLGGVNLNWYVHFSNRGYILNSFQRDGGVCIGNISFLDISSMLSPIHGK